MPVLFSVLRAADDSLREYMMEQLTRLVGLVRQHARRFLPDLLGLVHENWGKSSRVMHSSLQLLAELSTALRWGADGGQKKRERERESVCVYACVPGWWCVLMEGGWQSARQGVIVSGDICHRQQMFVQRAGVPQQCS
jgi:hypothetical protein